MGNCQDPCCAEDKEIMEVEKSEDGKWEKLDIVIDSGAMESVMSKEHAKNVRINRDNGQENQWYRAANGSRMRNQGEKRLMWSTDAGNVGGIPMQVTDVTKPLGSVGKICEVGNRIVFEPQGGYIESIST